MKPSTCAAAGVRRELEAAHRRAADLAAELDALEAATAEGPDDEHDPDGSTVGYERARVGALLAQSRADIAALGLAAARLDAGTYGRCQGCGRVIPGERLAALPSTTTCVGCAAGHDTATRLRAESVGRPAARSGRG
ncbi:MAG: TraR/DksA C4-type zinc finger protein [Actinomycetota bacterium]|nr:TraR/DksA C4-type zinc finger protein [Actinomycetota bacterium]